MSVRRTSGMGKARGLAHVGQNVFAQVPESCSWFRFVGLRLRIHTYLHLYLIRSGEAEIVSRSRWSGVAPTIQFTLWNRVNSGKLFFNTDWSYIWI